MPPWGVLWPVLRELAPRLWRALVEGRPPEAITLAELLDEQRLLGLRRRAAREAARRRLSVH